MAIELYNDGSHVCLMFNDLVDDSGGSAVQANQFLIVSKGEGALIDPSALRASVADIVVRNSW